MKVGVTQYNYLLGRINNKIHKLEAEQVQLKQNIDTAISEMQQRRVMYTGMHINIDLFVNGHTTGIFVFETIRYNLYNAKVSKSILSPLLALLRKMNQYYYKNTNALLRYSVLAKMPYSAFIIILRDYNLLQLTRILKGGNMHIGKSIGYIRLIEKKRNTSNTAHTSAINQFATSKAKRDIIATGEIPYCKVDADACELAGIPYRGKKYIVYYTTPTNIWYEFSRCGLCLIKQIYNYKFIPSNYYHGKIATTEEYYKTLRTFEDIVINDDLGATQKLVAMQVLNPHFGITLK